MTPKYRIEDEACHHSGVSPVCQETIQAELIQNLAFVLELADDNLRICHNRLAACHASRSTRLVHERIDDARHI